MSLRFLVTGDIQADNWKQFSYTREDGYNSRLYNCLKVFDVLRKEAKKRGITKVLINGDLFEKSAYIDVEVFDGLYQRIERMHDEGLDIVVNLGNHDVLRSNGRLVHSLRPLRKVATVVEEPVLMWDKVWVVPWMSKPRKFKDIIRCLDAKGKVLVCHVGVQGAKTGPTGYLMRNPVKVVDLRPDEFELVLLSDYHTRQFLANNVLYLGSPLQHSFGEPHRPCIWEVKI